MKFYFYLVYKENHTFETISKNSMKYDLKRRYRKKDFGYIRIGIFFIIGSILILFIPMTEIMLMPIKCVDGKVNGIKNAETCWKSIHYLQFSFIYLIFYNKFTTRIIIIAIF